MHVAHSTKTTPRDARHLRTERTRTRIADAMTALIHEGCDSPRAVDIAKRAGVSPRTVFHHFKDMETLYVEIIRQNEPRVARLVVTLDPALPLDARARALVEQRHEIYRVLAPLRRAVQASDEARTSPAIRAAGRRLQHVLARHAAESFAGELHGRPDRFSALERIAAVTSYEMWNHFVHVQRLGAARLKRHMLIEVLREFV